MGADGHIHIWRSSVVRATWPDADELFDCLPSHYRHALDGVEYDHCYFGDNLYQSYTDPDDWYMPHYPGWDGSTRLPLTAEEEAANQARRRRLEAFVAWLDETKQHWEVWT